MTSTDHHHHHHHPSALPPPGHSAWRRRVATRVFRPFEGSVLGWPAWLRMLAVLPLVLLLWLAVVWANAGVSAW